MGYYLTQNLTGQECFGSYFNRFTVAEGEACDYCSNQYYDTKHTLLDCEVSNDARQNMCDTVGEEITSDNMIGNMEDYITFHK